MTEAFVSRTRPRGTATSRFGSALVKGDIHAAVRSARASVQAGRLRAFSVLIAGADPDERLKAAQAVAGTLRVDLFRIDLSRVVGKFIGETESNLRRAFSAAERAGAVLFFDEADALFGKRSEVKDAHDRYADLVAGHLTQNLKAHPGVVAWGMASDDRNPPPGRPTFDAVVRLRPDPTDPGS
jgi:AAA+ superfamily predicted ATPase